MIYKLTLNERVTLIHILPPTGTFVTLGLVRRLRETLSCSEEEIKEHGIVETVDAEAGTVTTAWKPESAAVEFDIEIGEKMTDLVVKTLKDLDAKEQLTDQHFSLYEKFIGG